MRLPTRQSAAAFCARASVILGIAFAVGLLTSRFARADTATIFSTSAIHGTDGRRIYEAICQGCHMADARGAVGAGSYPALAQNRKLISRQFMALTVLAGRGNMPAFGVKHAIGFLGSPATLSDEQIAAVVNYVRTHFGNHFADSITAAEVTALDQDIR
jgi:mono/diheme cytochrome c family protein